MSVEEKFLTRLSAQANYIWETAQERLPGNCEASQYIRDRRLDPKDFGYLPVGQRFRCVDEVMLGRLEKVLFGRIMFAFKSPSGAIIGFGSRGVGEAKYYYSSIHEGIKTSTLLYGLEFIGQDDVWVVEGATDVLALRQGGVFALGAMGTRLIFEQAAVVAGAAKNVVICYDHDPAGKDATKTALKELAKFETIPAVVVPGNEGDDPFDAWIHGREFMTYTASSWILTYLGKEWMDLYRSLFSSEAAFHQLSQQSAF